jgi:DNA repair exonuclease SbcCD ATPase subunit
MSWIIRQITCRDLRGFNGQYVFRFEAGLNVIHADNNQGKSSLVDCLRWALIGEYPRWVGQEGMGITSSFSLINKNAGLANGMPEVVVELVNAETDDEMIITRRGFKKIGAKPALTDGQKSLDLEPLEVSVGDNLYLGWAGDAQAVIEEQLDLEPSTLATCSVVGQDDIMAMISGKPAQMNNVLHDLLNLRTLVEMGPILAEGKKESTKCQKKFKEQLEGPESPVALWEATNTQLAEDFGTKKEEVRDEHGFEWDEVESNALIEESIEQRLSDCESSLEVDFSELDIGERATKVQTAVDALANQDPTNKIAKNLGVEAEKISRLIEDLESASESWAELEIEMSELVDEGELDLVALATEMTDTKKLFDAKKAKKEALDLSEKLSTSVLTHLDNHSELKECPICKSPAEHAALKMAAEALMGPEMFALRTELNSAVGSLESQSANAKSKYESAEQLHTNILAGINDLTAVDDQLPDNMEMQLQSAEELLAGAAAISDCVEEIGRVNNMCKERQKEIEQENGQLEEQSATWREETLEPLRVTLREVHSLNQLLAAYTAIDNHAGRYEDVEVEQAALQARLKRATELKAMLTSLANKLTASQLENAAQAIEEANPLINDIFGTVCGNPQYDQLQITPNMNRGKIVYSFTTLPEMRTLGDIAAVVLSGGNQAVASIAALMALAASDSHQFPTLVLDDPCVQMDPATAERWAGAASEFAQNQQLIVLTHQPEVADYLEENGASRDNLQGWDQGMLPGRGE